MQSNVEELTAMSDRQNGYMSQIADIYERLVYQVTTQYQQEFAEMLLTINGLLYLCAG